MENMWSHCINISAPNLVNICVDQIHQGEIEGRMYHCYSREPIAFSNIIELLREAEKLFDEIAFPQASTKTRSFVEKEQPQGLRRQRPERILTKSDLMNQAGAIGTFLTSVRFRQNSTWQGDLLWLEQEKTQRFSNTLEFIKQIDTALQKEVKLKK